MKVADCMSFWGTMEMEKAWGLKSFGTTDLLASTFCDLNQLDFACKIL